MAPARKEEPVAHPKEDLIRKAYDAFGSGDIDTIREPFAEDIEFHVPGKNLSPATSWARIKS
jgi:ketosteroid isomerase-like protein